MVKEYLISNLSNEKSNIDETVTLEPSIKGSYEEKDMNYLNEIDHYFRTERSNESFPI